MSEFPFLKPLDRNSLLLEEAKRQWEILRFAADKEIALLRFQQREMTLEDLFLEVVEQ